MVGAGVVIGGAVVGGGVAHVGGVVVGRRVVVGGGMGGEALGSDIVWFSPFWETETHPLRTTLIRMARVKRRACHLVFIA